MTINDSSPKVFLIIIMALLGCALTSILLWGTQAARWPQNNAEAAVIATVGPQATLQALAAMATIQANEAAIAAAVAPDEAVARSGVWWAVLTVAASGALVSAVYAAGRTVQTVKTARAPHVREIGYGLLIEYSAGGPYLVDTYTGQVRPLYNAQAVGELRAAIIERLLVTGRLAQSAERIALVSRSPQPADVLPGLTPPALPGQEISRGKT